MSPKNKYRMLDITARLCAVCPPLIATFYYFPEWIATSERATFSGMALVAILVCMIPFWKLFFNGLRKLTATSMPVFWLIMFALLFIVKEIIDKAIYVSLFGFAGSVASMVLFAYAKKKYKEDDK